MILDADLLDKGIVMLGEYLSEGVVVVNFTKQDGSARRMRCTKRVSLIPTDKLPTPKLPTDVQVVKDPQRFVVWDLDKQAWRSFNYTTIKSMAVIEQSA